MQLFDNRSDMLSLVPRNGVIAELGVFAGDFSAEILEVCQPKTLHLVDAWAGFVFSGNRDGNDGKSANGDELFANVSKRFQGRREVAVHRRESMEALNAFKDRSLDAVYIDDDHCEEAIYNRMSLAMSKVKKGGWIMGHDFLCNPARASVLYPFTVAAGVVRFLKCTGLKLSALALDGWVSFAIQTPKR